MLGEVECNRNTSSAHLVAKSFNSLYVMSVESCAVRRLGMLILSANAFIVEEKTIFCLIGAVSGHQPTKICFDVLRAPFEFSEVLKTIENDLGVSVLRKKNH